MDLTQYLDPVLLRWIVSLLALGSIIYFAMRGIGKSTSAHPERWSLVLGAIGGGLWHAMGWIDSPGPEPWDSLGSIVFGVLLTFVAAGATDMNLLNAFRAPKREP